MAQTRTTPHRFARTPPHEEGNRMEHAMTNARVRLAALPLVFILVHSLDAFASQVFLKNGDRITGAATSSRDRSVTFHSALIGDVEIPWDAVERAVILENVFVPAALRKIVKTP